MLPDDPAWSLHLPELTPPAVTTLLLLLALFAAEAAVRFLRFPRIAALVLAGAAVGALRAHNPLVALMPLPVLLLQALAMILLFEVGQRVPLAWIRRNPWVRAASLCETGAAFLAIAFVVAVPFGRSWTEASLVGAICMAASPIVILSVSKDLGARGQVAERALLFSTLSCVYAALAMQLLVTGALAAAHVQLGIALQPLLQLAGSFVLGALAAGLLRGFAWVSGAQGATLTVGILCCCVLLYVAAMPMGLSPVLAALFFGLVVRATDATHRLRAHQSSETGSVLTLGYFILLGAALPGAASLHVAGIAVAVVVARMLAKVLVNAIFAGPSALRPDKGAAVGMALSPLSSLALLFASDIGRHPALRTAADISATVVLILAILGPVLTELALRAVHEPTRKSA